MEVCGSLNINPLLLDDVVETVFEYLKLAELKRARLVCHIWCRNAARFVPNRCKPNLLFGDGKRQLDAFLKLARSSFYPLPHRKITLQSSILSLQRSQSLETFFISCGPFLQSLFITYRDASHKITANSFSADYNNNLFPNLVELPVLKHLHYEELPSTDTHPGYHRGALQGYELFDILLRASVNLERLDLILPDTTTISKTEHHFLSLVNCSKGVGTLRHLHTLMLKLPLQDYHFELLEQAGLLRVANIQLRFHNEQCSVASPLKFFESCAGSLRSLSTNIWMKGFSDRSSPDQDFRFPCLHKLETLEISQWRSFVEQQANLPFNFSFKMSFPQLRKLTLQSHAWERCWNTFFPGKEVCHTLQELKLPKMLDNREVIPKIASTFPELKKLDVTVIPSSVDILSDVFCYLWRLEELSVNFLHDSRTTVGGGVRYNMCIDYVMTGIPEAICKKIYSEDRIPNVKVDSLDTGYSLASLRYLKTLQLKNLSSVSYGIPQLTDITGYLGLMKLKRLKTLYIWRSQMSDECISDLDRNFKLFLYPNF